MDFSNAESNRREEQCQPNRVHHDFKLIAYILHINGLMNGLREFGIFFQVIMKIDDI